MIVLLDRAAGNEGTLAPLAEGEAHHLRVRRARPGDRVEVRNGAGLVGAGRLVQNQAGWSVELDERRLVPPARGVTLAVAAGDRERFEWLAEKATELGVAQIVPIETEHTAAVASRLRAQHVPKLRKRALEALKQCGAAWVPAIREPVRLAVLLAERHEGERWLADLDGSAAAGTPPSVVLVGPEGGLTGAERAAAFVAGYRSVRLGPHILRFETAAIVAAALAAALDARGGIDG
jgi:16S rRNA (uracil1498-N3)-methyltransferase